MFLLLLMSKATIVSQPTRLQFCHELEILIWWDVYFLKKSHIPWPSQIKSVSPILHSLHTVQMLHEVNVLI